MQAPVDRQFYSFDLNLTNKSHFHTPSSEEKEQIVEYVADNIIGKDKVFSGPYGFRSAVFLDWIASGRSLSFIEDYIQNQVLPEYGNTHTTTSVTSLQTTLFRHEARDIIRNMVNASEQDSVIFTGNGSTGAIHKLIHALELKQPPVVFVGPYEHHSNLLPWKERCAEVVRIKQTDEGLVDISHLEEQLQAWSGSGRQLIGSFSAASNVTGILSEVDTITIMLHRHSALALWDYATAAPYVRLDMNPVISGKDVGLVYKDAMFISPHKFVGGVSTPGVLVVKKKLFQNTVPEQCGGGTVFYVRRESHRYLREPELREEGGTPDIVGAIRAGLVFQLKSAITPEIIMEKERQLCRRAVEMWSSVTGLVILGNLQADRLPIFSFLVHHPLSGLFLHHNYVSALLNDLFGIQARGGCACAGPYAMDLLGLTEDKAAEIEELLAEDRRLDRVHLRRYMEYSHREVLRPGFTRLNLPFFLSDQQLHFVLQAVAMVAEHGWKLLPQYMFNPETGEWRHREHQVFKERKWLGHISYAKGHMQYSLPKVTPKGHLPESLEACLEAAREIFNKTEKTKTKLADHTLMFDEDARPYRWFLLPSEAIQLLTGHRSTLPSVPWHPSTLPFCPPDLRQRLVEAEGGGEGGCDGGGSVALCSGDDGSQGVPSCQRIQVEGGVGNGERIKTGKTAQHGVRVEIGEWTDAEERTQFGERTGSGEQTESAEKTEIETKAENRERTDNGERTGGGEEGTTEAKRMMETISSSSLPACNQRPCLLQPGTRASSKSCIPCLQQPATRASPRETTDANSAVGCECETFTQSFQTALERGYGSQSSNHSEPCQLYSPPNSSPDCLPVTEPALNCLPCVNGRLASSSQSSAIEQVTAVPTSTSSAEATAVKSKKKNKESARGESHGATDAGTQKSESCKKEVIGNRWYSPPKDIFKPSIKALETFSMIKDGDRVLVCLSGGKDSLSLLHTMHQCQFYCKSKGLHFKLGAVTVDPQTPSYDPSSLKGYLAELGVPYFYESQGIMESAINLPYECASICSFCSRMKRGRIYATARREGYNVLALGQHLDDLAESFLMSLFHNGSLRTMKAHYTVKEGDLRVIRPFVYVREKDLRQFAEKNKLPVIAENCPACFEAPKERHRIKQLLASQEILHPHLYSSILSAIRPVMALTRSHSTAFTILTALGQNQADDHDDFDI